MSVRGNGAGGQVSARGFRVYVCVGGSHSPVSPDKTSVSLVSFFSSLSSVPSNDSIMQCDFIQQVVNDTFFLPHLNIFNFSDALDYKVPE